MDNNDKISIHQLLCLVLINLMGSSLLNMSGRAASYAGTDGWISILIGAGLALIYGSVITVVCRKYPDMTMTEILERRAGRTAAVLIGGIFWLLLVAMAVVELRMFTAIIRQTLLQRTPVLVIVVTMLGCIVYAALKGCECRARMAEIALLFILLPLLFLIVFALPQIEPYQLGPLLVARPADVWLGGFRLSLLYIPICLLQMGGCFVGRTWRPRILRTVLLAILATAALNLILFFLTVGCLGKELTANSLWPLMQVMAVVDIPILEIERQDALLMAFWILTEFTLITSYVFYAGITWQKLTHQINHRKGVIIAAVLVLLLSLPSADISQLFEADTLVYGAMGGLFLLPVPLLLMLGKGKPHA